MVQGWTSSPKKKKNYKSEINEQCTYIHNPGLVIVLPHNNAVLFRLVKKERTKMITS